MKKEKHLFLANITLIIQRFENTYETHQKPLLKIMYLPTNLMITNREAAYLEYVKISDPRHLDENDHTKKVMVQGI